MAVILGGPGIFLGGASAPPAPPFVNEYSMTFDETDLIQVGTSSLGITSAITVSAWVKIPTTNTGGGGTNIQSIICEDTTSGGQRNWNLSWRGTGFNYFQWSIWNTDLSATTITSTGIVPNDGFWHHVMGTYDGTSGANGMKLYIDGVLNAQGTATSTGINSNTGSEATIGALTGGGGRYFLGEIDSVAVWDSDESSNINSIYSSSGVPDISSLNPLSWWRMGDGDSFVSPNWTFFDNGSGGNDATSTTLPEAARLPITANSYSQNSFVFDGTDFVTMGNPASLQITGNITLSAWVQTSYSADVQVIIGKDGINTGQRSYLLNVATSGIPAFYIFTSSGQKNVQGLTTINDGNWHHIMAVNDGTDLKIYIDGTLNNTTVGGGDTMLNGAIDFNIGRRQAAAANRDYFVGNIDEVYVWDNDQSGNISTIYGNGVPTDISSLNPLGHWRFGETDVFTTSWTFVDQGSGGNDGTSTTFPESAKTGDQPYVI